MCGYFEGREGEALKQALKERVKKARGVALGLAETFNLNEDFLFTTIGSVSRNPYEALMDDARKNNPLNRRAVQEGFMKHIKPLMRAKL